MTFTTFWQSLSINQKKWLTFCTFQAHKEAADYICQAHIKLGMFMCGCVIWVSGMSQNKSENSKYLNWKMGKWKRHGFRTSFWTITNRNRCMKEEAVDIMLSFNRVQQSTEVIHCWKMGSLLMSLVEDKVAEKRINRKISETLLLLVILILVLVSDRSDRSPPSYRLTMKYFGLWIHRKCMNI